MIYNVLFLSIHAFNSYIQITKQYETNINYNYIDYQHIQTTVYEVQEQEKSKISRLLE
jgi:hypothetical protein